MARRIATDNVGEALTNSRLTPKPSTLADQIKELGGAKVVAAISGRAVRSAYRWLRGENKPNAAAQAALDQASATYRASPPFRRQIKPSRIKRFRSQGAQVRFKGIGGPINKSPRTSLKRRNLLFNASSDAMKELTDAWIKGGDDAAMGVLGSIIAGEYMDTENEGWMFTHIERLEFSYLQF